MQQSAITMITTENFDDQRMIMRVIGHQSFLIHYVDNLIKIPDIELLFVDGAHFDKEVADSSDIYQLCSAFGGALVDMDAMVYCRKVFTLWNIDILVEFGVTCSYTDVPKNLDEEIYFTVLAITVLSEHGCYHNQRLTFTHESFDNYKTVECLNADEDQHRLQHDFIEDMDQYDEAFKLNYGLRIERQLQITLHDYLKHEHHINLGY